MNNVTRLETLKNLIEKHMEFAKKMFKETGEYTPMIIGYTGTKRIVIVIPFENEDEKFTNLQFVKLVFLAKGVKRYTIVHEGYMLKTMDTKEYDKLRREGKRICDHPDHIEVLQAIAISEKESRSIIYKINKDKSLELFEDNTDDEISGIFTELLPPKNTPKHIIESAKECLKEMNTEIQEYPYEDDDTLN